MVRNRWFLLMTLVIAGCTSANQSRYAADRDRLTEAFTHFNQVNELTQPPPGRSTMESTPELDSAIVRHLRDGLEAGRHVGDAFLDWLHPQMRAAFRDNYLAGQQLYYDGLVEHDVAKQLRGNMLIEQWHNSFWTANKGDVFSKAFGE